MKIKDLFPLLVCSAMVLMACDTNISGTDSSSSGGGGSTSSSSDTKQTIATFALPQQIVDSYNLAIRDREDATKINTDFNFQEDRFFITDNYSYKVGDDNPFIFMPKIDAYVDATSLDTIVLTSYHSVAHVDIWETSAYRELGPSEIAGFVSIDNVNSAFDFTEEAIGHKFKLRVLPDSKYYTFGNNVSEKSFEIEVIEGYNVHTVAELSMLDNHSPLWEEYKTAHGLSMEEKPKGIILHNDIRITKDDVPAGYFFTANDAVEARMPGITNYVGPDGLGPEAVVGSLKDSANIYAHDTPVGETFVFEGNFFTIDGSEMPVVRKFRDKLINQSGEAQGSHAQLFGFPGDGHGGLSTAGDDGAADLDVAMPAEPQTEQGDVIIRNMNVIGNGGRDNSGLSNGGFIFTKSAAKNTTWENVIARNMFISFFARSSIAGPKSVNSYINFCKSYDSYNSMVFYWGSENNFVNHSILKRSGGALFMCTELWDASDSENNYPNRTLANLTTLNSEFDASVSGGEPWFESHQATSLVSMLKALGPLFVGYQQAGINTAGKNIVKNDKMNIIALLIRAADPLTNTETEFKSTISINNAATPFNSHNLMTQTQYGPLIDGQGQFLTFESAAGGRGYLDATSNFSLFTETYVPMSFAEALQSGNPSHAQNVLNFFSGNTMNLYLKAMAGTKNIGVVLGY